MKTIVTIDFDNVLADSARCFLAYYHDRYWDLVDYESINHAYLQDNPEFTKFNWFREYFDFLDRAHQWNHLKPMEWLLPWIQLFQDMWFDLHIVTWRENSQKSITQAWLDLHLPWVFTAIHYANDMTKDSISKGEICSWIWSILHLDDFFHYSESVADQEIPVLLFSAPWNTWYQWDNSYITRIHWRNSINHSLIFDQLNHEENNDSPHLIISKKDS